MRFKQIAENVYYMTPGENDRPALGYISCGGHSIMIDSGNSPAHAKIFIAELKKRNLKYPDYLALTHWHWDHIFGTSSIDAKIVTNDITAHQMKSLKALSWSEQEFEERIKDGLEIPFCRDNMKKELGDISSDMIRLPDLTFGEHYEIGDGNQVCNIIHIGGDHSSDSSVIHSPGGKVVFIGDCLYVNAYAKPPCYTKNNLVPLLNKLLSMNAEIYVDSHEEDLISYKDISTLMDLVLGVIAKTEEGRNTLLRSDFPNNVENKFCNNLLESWDMFIDYQ